MTTTEKLYIKAKHQYYIGEPIMTDFEFDKLEELISEKIIEIKVEETKKELREAYNTISYMSSIESKK
jgi:hypothetical protein